MVVAPQISEAVTPPKLFLQAMYAAFRLGLEPVHCAEPFAPPARAGGVLSVMVNVNVFVVVSPHLSVAVKVSVIWSVQPVDVQVPSV